MTSRTTWLIARVANEGYCCPAAYLRLCKARGEEVKAMAVNIGMSPHTLWYHYRKMEKNTGPVCQKRGDCMDRLICEIEAEKKPAEAG